MWNVSESENKNQKALKWIKCNKNEYMKCAQVMEQIYTDYIGFNEGNLIRVTNDSQIVPSKWYSFSLCCTRLYDPMGERKSFPLFPLFPFHRDEVKFVGLAEGVHSAHNRRLSIGVQCSWYQVLALFCTQNTQMNTLSHTTRRAHSTPHHHVQKRWVKIYECQTTGMPEQKGGHATPDVLLYAGGWGVDWRRVQMGQRT